MEQFNKPSRWDERVLNPCVDTDHTEYRAALDRTENTTVVEFAAVDAPLSSLTPQRVRIRPGCAGRDVRAKRTRHTVDLRLSLYALNSAVSARGSTHGGTDFEMAV